MNIMKYLFVLIFSSLIGCSPTINDKKNQDIENFHFVIENGANDSYNSKTGQLTRFYIGGKKFFDVPLHLEELKSIYNLFDFYSFSDMPSEFIVDNESCMSSY